MRLRFSDEDIRKALGYQEPKDIKTLDQSIHFRGVNTFDFITPYIRLIWDWIVKEKVLVTLIVLGVFFGVLWVRKE